MKTAREEMLAAFANFSIDQLDKAHATYVSRNDAANAAIVQEAISRHGRVQTTEMANCGKLFKHTSRDSETGRVVHRFTGDIGAMLEPFTQGGGPISGRFDSALYSGANSPQARAFAASQVTVSVKPGERVMVVKE